ncbi:unnamed protein product [Adineta steineri]|uniref:Uncharacterized protein n=1 Tax=Adineta steineri TaxID=433720 RepID=A0A816ALL4_9BILA|nr:unnamed protein product [Adineta steineri]CAF1597338.1 unnamed protein product [Adineta steineri]
MNINSLQYDCLNYHIYYEKPAHQELLDVIDEVIPYCFRPEKYHARLFENPGDLSSQILSFEQLRLRSITSLQLLSWSVSIDIAQRYEFYLSMSDTSLNEEFYNCTEPWFGSRCQYSFGFNEQISFNQIVEATFRQRKSFSESSEVIVQVPCYVLLKCHRNGQPWCLDWREVCNGIIDCFDEGSDEENCFDMEINKCEENEYRCHNGLCISGELWEDGAGDADCLDRSDEILDLMYKDSCFQDPTFHCEEHSCRPDGGAFACGDGQCVRTLSMCENDRHLLLIESMKSKGNLKDECWITMVCLTELDTEVDGNSCEIWLMNISIDAIHEECDSFFQFPTVPIHAPHIRFFYENFHLNRSVDEFFFPNYICYDQQLCHHMKPDLIRENLTCLDVSELKLRMNYIMESWIEIIEATEQHFRPCLIYHVSYENKTKDSTIYSSLYKCQNSSKVISTSRIRDRQIDCFQLDDETYEHSCQLNDKYRVRCGETNTCWSPILKNGVCLLHGEYGVVSFDRFCNGVKEYSYNDHDGIKHDDEEGCEIWLCNNMYSRCDGYWACKDGRDEDNCGHSKCPSGTHACVDPFNYTVSCLPAERVNNGNVDCFGASDEQHECRRLYPPTDISARFRCSTDNECLSSFQLCDDELDCPKSREDEGELCYIFQVFNCKNDLVYNRNDVEQVLCDLSEQDNRRIRFFSIQTLSTYPSLEQNFINKSFYWPIDQPSVIHSATFIIQNSSWYCNRGLTVHLRSENDTFNNECKCPPSYYGHLCQYQNQRVSLTLHISSVDRHTTYAIVIMLIDEIDKRQDIHSYDQFVYITKQSCSIKLNRYLLFPERPKNISHNYSIRIDAFETTQITYVGSWYFPVTFLFLPVNRLAISLILSNQTVDNSSNCLMTCVNGRCVKYLNTNKYFCRCNSKWAGIHCNISINQQICSHDSFHLGITYNQSICVCPLNKFGSRCLFKSTCPIAACKNNGKCVPADVTKSNSRYTCICPNRYFGDKCQDLKARLNVSLIGIDIPAYVVGYFFTLSNQSNPITTIKLQKLTLFQHSVTFYISMIYHMVIVQANNRFYLAVIQQLPQIDLSTSVRSSQECIPVERLLNSTILNMTQYRRIVFFHKLCYMHHDLTCFIDEAYLCLCTNEHHANCMEFKHDRSFQCKLKKYCANEAECVQDHPTCPSTRICICPECFFGNECQFYAKALGSTLDEILGYEFKRNVILSQQPITVKVSAVITMIIFLIGLINCILSMIIFRREASQKVGCGIYLLTASINSLAIMILFTLKFWLLFLSYQLTLEERGLQTILLLNCRIVEPLLKVILYIDKWLHACVAIERIISVRQGINFDKQKSLRVAKYVIITVILSNFAIYIPQIIDLRVFTDKTEERSWCVVTYTSFVQIYSFTLIMFHYVGPLIINFISAATIIIITTRQRTTSQKNLSFKKHLVTKIKQHKHLLISPMIIITLTLPHLIISFVLKCDKSTHLLWFYLSGYFLSFIPSTCMFLIFVLPSPIYKKEFKHAISHYRRRFHIFLINNTTQY